MNDNHVKRTVIVAITIIVMIVAIIGASYAYLAANIGSAVTTQINVISGTVDNLVFIPGSNLVVTANQDNFGSGSGDKNGSITSQVKLTANSYSSSTQYYRAYIVISGNDFVYTSGTTPELLLTVKRGSTTVINNMDVTTTKGVIDVPVTSGGTTVKQSITASAGTTTTETWTATVTFVNLSSNQNANAGKHFQAKLLLEESPLLASGYQELVYVTSSGSQYIDTYFTPNQNSTARIDFQITTTASGANCLFGTRNGSAGVSAMTFFKGSNGYWAYSFGNQNNGSISTYDTTRHMIGLEGLKLYMDDNVKTTFNSVSNFTAVHSAYLMAYSNNASGALGSGFKGNVYSCKLYDSGNLERNFVPCKRTSDSVIGMCDTVYGNFHENIGSGTFTAGPNAI
jgi:hypothetical protein